VNNNKYSKKVTWSVEVVVDNVCLVYTQSSFGGFSSLEQIVYSENEDEFLFVYVVRFFSISIRKIYGIFFVCFLSLVICNGGG